MPNGFNGFPSEEKIDMSELNMQKSYSKLTESSEPTPQQGTAKWQPNENAYIGTKVVRALRMSESEFLVYHKGKSQREVDQQETQGEGYRVTYEDGYVSWSPKEVFERCYRQVSDKEHSLITTW